MKRYKHECLKSYSITRSGDVIKKFDFPALQPLTNAQRENKMIDMVYQAVGQAFVNTAPVMTKTMHNAVLKMVGATHGYLGPCYMQPNQMGFAPMGSTTAASPLDSVGRSEENNGQMSSQTTGVTSLPQTNPIFLLHHRLRQRFKVDLPWDSHSDGIRLLDFACRLSSLFHHPWHSSVHRLPSR